MSGKAPLTRSFQVRTPPVAAGSDKASVVCRVPFDGTVTSVTFIADGAMTGNDTNYRYFDLYERTPAGGFGLAFAQLQFTAGVNVAAAAAIDVPLHATPANRVVTEGNHLEVQSIHVASGIADPGGLFIIEIERA